MHTAWARRRREASEPAPPQGALGMVGKAEKSLEGHECICFTKMTASPSVKQHSNEGPFKKVFTDASMEETRWRGDSSGGTPRLSRP